MIIDSTMTYVTYRKQESMYDIIYNDENKKILYITQVSVVVKNGQIRRREYNVNFMLGC